jgi:hypothetical protein
MKRLLADNGLIINKIWGSFEKDKFSADTKRMIILAKKL